MTQGDEVAGTIEIDRKRAVTLIGIDRVPKLNGFSPQMCVGLADAFDAFEIDDEARVAVLYGKGPHFTAGVQLDAVAEWFGKGTVGIELMLAADILVTASDTRFGQVEVKRGIYANHGATLRFVERSGWGNAMRYLLTGDEFDAPTALRLGLVQEVVKPGR